MIYRDAVGVFLTDALGFGAALLEGMPVTGQLSVRSCLQQKRRRSAITYSSLNLERILAEWELGVANCGWIVCW